VIQPEPLNEPPFPWRIPGVCPAHARHTGRQNPGSLFVTESMLGTTLTP
jgi:hypothetical protein